MYVGARKTVPRVEKWAKRWGASQFMTKELVTSLEHKALPGGKPSGQL